AVAALMAAGWVAATPAASADEDLLPSGSFSMGNIGDDSGQCYERFQDTDLVQLEKCDSSKKGQQWTAEKLSDGRFKLHNGAGGCLQWEEEPRQYESRDYRLRDCAKAAHFEVESAPEGTVWFKETDESESTTYLMVKGGSGHLDRNPLSNSDLKISQWKITEL
ncbi:hypothetical protein, partial [Nocardia brasiliensis]|uniref:hypothetical protein n=1 Tax=Nocardia brasiliensis TaxID=37326 RepID=UPI0033CEC206